MEWNAEAVVSGSVLSCLGLAVGLCLGRIRDGAR